jgi:hypothetical protein
MKDRTRNCKNSQIMQSFAFKTKAHRNLYVTQIFHANKLNRIHESKRRLLYGVVEGSGWDAGLSQHKV